MTVAEIMARPGLVLHPEGGHDAETCRHSPEDGGRGACTAIYHPLTVPAPPDWDPNGGTQ